MADQVLAVVLLPALKDTLVKCPGIGDGEIVLDPFVQPLVFAELPQFIQQGSQKQRVGRLFGPRDVLHVRRAWRSPQP